MPQMLGTVTYAAAGGRGVTDDVPALRGLDRFARVDVFDVAALHALTGPGARPMWQVGAGGGLKARLSVEYVHYEVNDVVFGAYVPNEGVLYFSLPRTALPASGLVALDFTYDPRIAAAEGRARLVLSPVGGAPVMDAHVTAGLGSLPTVAGAGVVFHGATESDADGTPLAAEWHACAVYADPRAPDRLGTAPTADETGVLGLWDAAAIASPAGPLASWPSLLPADRGGVPLTLTGATFGGPVPSPSVGEQDARIQRIETLLDQLVAESLTLTELRAELRAAHTAIA